MYFNFVLIASLAALLATVAAAPISNRKRYPASVTAPKLPTITACTIPRLGAPVGCADGGGYLRRAIDSAKIVIGSKRSPDPQHGKLDSIETDAASYVDQASYAPKGPTGDQASYRVDEIYDGGTVGADDEEKRSLSSGAEGLPILTKRDRVVDHNYPNDDVAYQEEKREAAPLRPVKIEIDGDYPPINDESYPVKREEGPADEGNYDIDGRAYLSLPVGVRPIDLDYTLPIKS